MHAERILQKKKLEVKKHKVLAVDPKNIGNFIEKNKITKPFEFLKLIKKVDQKIFILVNDSFNSDLYMDIPIYAPTSLDELSVYNKIWPCKLQYKKLQPLNNNLIQYINILEKASSDKCTNHYMFIYENKIEFESKNKHLLEGIKNISKTSKTYLATNYELVCNSEPCVGCAMALIHSRIKSVLFKKTRSIRGFRQFYIHQLDFTNHRFDVFMIS